MELVMAPLFPVADGEVAVVDAVEVPEAEDEAELVPLLVALVHETLEGMLAELLKTTSAHWERY